MEGYYVIGIDPGSIRTGWGIVREESGKLELVDCGIIRSPSKENMRSFSCRLGKIYNDLRAILINHKLQAAAIEQIFTAQNAQSALKLGQARGVAAAACASVELEIYDYEPTLVKKSIVGNGRAEKEQVAFMVKRLLNVPSASWALDTSDALGVAICHLAQRRLKVLAEKILRNGKAV